LTTNDRKIFLDILVEFHYNIHILKIKEKIMNWVEYGIYGVCLIGSGYISYDIGFRRGVSDCLTHLENEGFITLEHDDDE